MKVRELIEKLRKFNPDAEVIVPHRHGKEIDDVVSVESVDNPPTSWEDKVIIWIETDKW